jgi:parallel beta-helix repeat protein
MADHLAPGQTGCFRSGTFASDDEIKVVRPGITLAGYPGERATLKGALAIEQGADGVTVSDLYLDGRSSGNIGPLVFASGVTFDSDDVTNFHSEICFVLGSRIGGRAVDTVIENSRIHDCGRLPSTNQDHGIYVAHASNAIIRNNWIYDNADRGIQLYPNSQGAQVYGNVIDGNGEGIIISGDGETASSDNLIYGNVISNSRIRWNVESLWPSGLVGRDNVVRDNCVFASNPSSYYDRNGGVLPPGPDRGFSTSGNAVAPPQFADPATGDFRLQGPSSCARLLAD